MTQLETSFYSLLFVYKEHMQIPISANSNNRKQFSCVMFLADASLSGPVQGEPIGFLFSTSLLGSDYESVLLTVSAAFHICLCNVPACILHLYIVPSKYIHKLLCMKSAYANPLSAHGSTPSHPYKHPAFWTGAPTCQFTVG